MMQFPDKATVERIRKAYPPGTRVEIIRMDDANAPPPGTIGEVVTVDDAGQLVMKWQNGSSLSIILDIDKIRKLD